MVKNFKEYIFDSILNECTSVATSVNGDVILAKNRDRTYAPSIRVIREIINGLECVYMYDEKTDYAEGMNEKGVGIVNTTLQGKKDENEGIDMKLKNRGRISKDGYKIRKALGYDDIKDVVKILDLYDRGLGGHTTIGYPEGFYSIEKLSFGKPIIKRYNRNAVIVRTNHGIGYPDQGYQHGKDRESSLSRSFIATKEARKAKTGEEVLHNMRRHHNKVLGYLEPYRTNYKVWTSSQILLNLTKLEFTFVVDENTKFSGIENRLPNGYSPKIKVNIEEIETIFKVKSKASF
jgi:hypothetical protein